MTYRIEIERRPRQALGCLPKGGRIRVMSAIDALAEDPRPAGCVPVRAAPQGTCRIREGDYRVICLILDGEQIVAVAMVATRSATTYRKPG